jgi:thiol:disulfide interchange protein DsbD
MKKSSLLALIMLAPVAAQSQVKASLVAPDRSVQSGRPFTIALRLEHQPSWHTYWISAGTGYPTSLMWDLPASWSVGDIQWPVPKTIKDAQGHVTGNGFDGILELPVMVTPSAGLKAGEKVVLKAVAKYLMCSDVCIPGKDTLTLALPVLANAPLPNDSVRAELAQMPMPRTLVGGTIAAVRFGKTVTLVLTKQGALGAPHFFSEDAFIQYDQPQIVATDNGRVSITLPVSQDAEVSTQKLVGVLAYTDANGVYRGLRVDTPFSAPGVAGADATSEGGQPSFSQPKSPRSLASLASLASLHP